MQTKNLTPSAFQPVLFLGVVALAPAACGPSASDAILMATDGRTFEVGSGSFHDAEMATLRASGAHDLGCPAEQLSLLPLSKRKIDGNPLSRAGRSSEEWAIEGCGSRAVVRFVRDEGTFRAILVSKVALSPGSP